MKTTLITLLFLPLMAASQVNYTVTVTRLKAKADACDGGVPILCPLAPQDPVFNIWSNDADANQNTYCWIFDNDPEAEYNLWKDIQNVELANENNVNTTYISFDMSGFESDLPAGTTCTTAIGDEAVYDQQFVQLITLADYAQDSVFTMVLDLQATYYAEIEVYWIDANAGLNELDNNFSFVVAPNPSNGSVFLHVADASFNEFNLSVMDLTGREIYQANNLKNECQIDLNDQEAGSYFVRVESEGKTKTQTLILN